MENTNPFFTKPNSRHSEPFPCHSEGAKRPKNLDTRPFPFANAQSQGDSGECHSEAKSKTRHLFGGSKTRHLLGGPKNLVFSYLLSAAYCLLFIFLFTFAFTFTSASTAFAQSWDELAGSATSGGVSNNAGNSAEPSLALDASGNPHIAWWDDSGGNNEIYYAYWDGTQWTTYGDANTGGGVSNNAGASSRPSLALDAGGNPHIAWEDWPDDNWEIYYAYWDGDSWETYGGGNTGGGVSNNAGWSQSPSFALDSSGNPHIAWTDYSGGGGNNEIYYAYWDGSSWVTHDGANTGGGVSNNADDSLGPIPCPR